MTSPSVGSYATALQGTELFGMAPSVLAVVPPTASTPASGTTPTTWVSVGTVSVPTWATKFVYHLDIYGLWDTTTSDNHTVALLVGSASGVAQRILGPAVALQRFNHSIADTISSSLSSGSQSVVLQATRVAGAGSFTVDANSRISVYYSFQV